MSLAHRLLRKPFFGRFEVPWTWPEGTDPGRWQRLAIALPGDRAELAGLWGGAEGEARATLVLAHPMGKAAKGFWLKQGHAELFRAAGFNVLLFDANGFGESPARSFDYPADIMAAGLAAQAREPGLPVGLVGASFGAGWGLCAMAREGNPFRTAVLEAAFPTLPDFWRHYPVAHAMLRVSQLLMPWMEAGLRPEREAARVRGRPPVLLIYGEQDRYTPVAHGERLRAAFARVTEVELLRLPGVDHTNALRDAREAYLGRVLPFLRQSLNSERTP